MAAVLWGAGVSFGGVLPLLDFYRRHFGWRMAAYLAAVLYAAMVIAALVMDAAFGALGWIPAAHPDMQAKMTAFLLDYTFWLSLAFGTGAAALLVLARRHPGGAGQ